MYLFFMSIPCRTRAQHIEYCKKCQTISLHQVSNGYMSVWGQVQCHIQRYSPVKMFLYAITSLYADTAHVFCTFLCSCQGLRCKYPFLCSCVQKNVCMKMARFCVCVWKNNVIHILQLHVHVSPQLPYFCCEALKFIEEGVNDLGNEVTMEWHQFHLYMCSLPCHLTMLVAAVVGCHLLIVCHTLPWSVFPSSFLLTMHSEPECTCIVRVMNTYT